MSIADGANYAPQTRRQAVVAPGEFCFAAAFLDHGHIYGQTNGLLDAGATLTHVFDPDPERVKAFQRAFPQAEAVSSFQALLDSDALHLVAAAAIPDQRAAIGMQVLHAGKDYFTDKSPFTTLAQLNAVKALTARTGRRYFVYFAERVHNEAAWHAGDMIAQGAVGEVIQVLNLAPHRLAAASRPDWFFDKARYGGIITDIGSHQVEQFLTYADCMDAEVRFASVGNLNHPGTPGLEDFGELSLVGRRADTRCDPTFYTRIDWYTPDGMPVWGDGRSFIVGTEGTLEVRKYIDLGKAAPASMVLHVSSSGVDAIDCLGQIGFPYFGRLILDVLNRTELAMTQAHIFKAAEISLQAQAIADETDD